VGWNRNLGGSRRGIRVASVLVLGCTVGCSSLAERLGLRVRLDELPVTAVSASLGDRHDGSHVSALAPGRAASLVITARTQDGRQLATVGAGKGKVDFDNYRIEATVVTVGKRGIVSLSSDPRVSDGQAIHLHISPTAHPDIVADLDVAVRYDIPFVADFSGSNGFNRADGLAGLDGIAGIDGTPGASDPVTGFPGTSSPGGSGSDGGYGGDGSDGQDGSSGRDVSLSVRLKRATPVLLQIRVISGAHQLLYLVDPNGGSLKVVTNGGAGGRGGTGGRGGRGGRGGNRTPRGFDGHDGLRGQDGRAGRDAKGGNIVVSVDPDAQQFMKCISWSNRSGGGLPGPPPRINVEPVTPLW
jgi:hypothetical protein